MAEETNAHMKVAMADVMGILVISMFTFAVAVTLMDFGDTGEFIELLAHGSESFAS